MVPGEYWDHAPVEVGPVGLTVQEQYRRPGAFVEEMQAQPLPIEIVGREGIAGKVPKRVLRRAEASTSNTLDSAEDDV